MDDRNELLAALKELKRDELYAPFARAGVALEPIYKIEPRFYDSGFDRGAWVSSLSEAELRTILITFVGVCEQLFALQFRLLNDSALARRRAKSDRARAAANVKVANDPTQKVKACICRLWPLGKKKGWTAERYYLELVRNGHNAKPDTVRKWVTSLRKTGTC